MPDATKLSEARRALLEKYLRGESPQTLTSISAQESFVPLSYAEPRVPVVPIQTTGSKRPFFYLHVHAVGGAFYTFTLAHDLGPDQPFYMLEPYRLDDLLVAPTLETMAAAYIESMRIVQPEGPYLLGGFCGGGIIAFEMAQQLRAAGQAVDLLVLIEPKDGPAPHRLIFRRLLCGSFRCIGALLGLRLDKRLEWYLRLRHLALILVKSPYRVEQTSFSLFPSAESLRQDWIGMFTWVISQYTSHQYPGKVTYFWAREEPRIVRTWWGKIHEAKELETHLITGTHDSCRSKDLHDLAEHLSACLSKAHGFC